MEIAVVGGTGSVGALVVTELIARGDAVRILSRGMPAEPPPGASHHRVDMATGEGLGEALAGTEAVVDAVNATRNAKAVLVEGSRRLLAAEADAGVRHHVGISILGCDRVPLGYYRAKVAQEQAIAGGRIPWSLLRASQFHTLIATVFELWGRAHAVPTGKARLQPVDPRVVARRIADSVHEGPAGRLPDVAGPEIGTLTELAGAWRRHHGRRLLPVRLPMAGPIGRPLREAALCDPAAAAGGTTFEEWVAAR